MHVNSTAQRLIDTLTELVGIKSGLAISEQDFLHILEEGLLPSADTSSLTWWQHDRSTPIRLRPEVLEADFLYVMHRIGAIPNTFTPLELVKISVLGTEPPLFKTQKEYMDVFQKISVITASILMGETPTGMEDVAAKARQRSITNDSFPETREWDGIIPLGVLFESESIPTNAISGQYFDQRFIDYLAVQPERLSEIHWRQFEYLCGEYFRRVGYEIEITAPRGDGGIDVFARKETGIAGPELVIVQSKRLSGTNMVRINDVKAFWADLDNLKATKAVIATTTRLEAGAREYCEARQYRIHAAEVDDVQNWIRLMAKGISSLDLS